MEDLKIGHNKLPYILEDLKTEKFQAFGWIEFSSKAFNKLPLEDLKTT
jgi:hypothetical protein